MGEKIERVLNERYFSQDSGGMVALAGSKCSRCGKVFFPKKKVRYDILGNSLKHLKTGQPENNYNL